MLKSQSIKSGFPQDVCPCSVTQKCCHVAFRVVLIRSGAVFRSEGSPINPKDLLQIYVILAVGACVLCQFKVCCDVC